MEQALETLLFSSRYFVLLAVFGSITMGAPPRTCCAASHVLPSRCLQAHRGRARAGATMFFKGALSVQKARRRRRRRRTTRSSSVRTAAAAPPQAVQALLTNKGGEVSMRSIASLDEFLCAARAPKQRQPSTRKGKLR